jgi:P27 family predicted phage terminase small subunit
MAGRKGRSGRPRLPSAVKKARGTYQPSRAAPNEVSFKVTRLDPPAWLDEYALEEWRRIVPMLDEVKVLTDPDLVALANYCSTVSVAIRATIEVNKNLMAKHVNGAAIRRVNPLVKVAQNARAECLRFAIEFGLTPAARSRIAGQPPKNKDEKDSAKEAEEFFFHPPKLIVSNG